MAGRRVRAFWPQALIGRSVHRPTTPDEGEDVAALDYLLAGTLLPSASKSPHHQPLGREGLCNIVKSAEGCTVWAVGGITRVHLASILRTGAGGAAAIGAFQPDVDPRDLEDAVAEIAQEWRFSFDTAG
jgi:thiamine monophosphate synthase